MEKQLLTPREREVLSLVVQAMSNAEMSNALFITEKSIEKHLSSIFKKFSVKNRQELIVRFYQSNKSL